MAAWVELSASGTDESCGGRGCGVGPLDVVGPPSCLITRVGNMSVLPKWLRRGTPTIPGHPVIMGLPGFQRATHRNRAGVNSRQKCLHSEKLRSGGGKTDTRCSISDRLSAMQEKRCDEQKGRICARSQTCRRCGDPLILPRRTSLT
ncbi:hypothetical protein CRG98_014977 [Punica granatum]|uniref:Uncharacterized protein n=1 Tax=Punica granatum TaxID=22663 RepID=A0A2I0K7W0_PUNGR|nr:hypothetical protein CRG98_014977 [Punica granatum]